MALIYFYDSTELDKQQITKSLLDTDHHWEFIEEKISIDNLHPDTEVLSVFVTSTVTREIIEALPKLRLIACRSTGFNNIDFAAAKDCGVTIANVPTYGEHTVAEYAFTMLTSLMRKLPSVMEAENKAFSQEELRGNDLNGKTFGVLGTGHIGQKAMKIANGFSMNVIAYDAYLNQELEQELNFKYVDFETLLAQSDVLSVHLPYMRSTHHIINAEALSKTKRGAIIINTARGELIDTKALIEYLDNGHLGGAAIDVVEGEALLNHHEETALLRAQHIEAETMKHSVEISILKKMPNVIISPHNAFNTVEAIERINNTTVKNIIDYWYGNTPNKVEPSQVPPGKLLIARHAESEWNATGQWTGVTDVHLSEKGFKEAVKLGQLLKELSIPIDVAYCSEQIRTRETLEGMLNASQLFDVEIIRDHALNERDYGDYTGKNKWEVQKLIGDEKFNQIRRGWDVAVPNGESLRMVYDRVVPFFTKTILPVIKSGKNVLIVAHGNSIRALIKFIESINNHDIEELEMIFGQIIVYDVDDEGKMTDTTAFSIDTELPNY